MKDIKGYEGLYAITSCGRVWSYRNNKFLKPCESKGYLQVVLSVKRNKKHHYIHKLVAEAYIPNPENKKEANHLDENKQNNCVNNLAWATPKENVNWGTRTERQRKAVMKPVYCVELDKTFESIKATAEELKVSVSAVSACCHGKIETANGYHLNFVNQY